MVTLQQRDRDALRKETTYGSSVKAVTRTLLYRWLVFRYSGIARIHDLCGIIANNRVLTAPELLKVEVPMDFLGTGGFSAHREGR